MNVDVSHLCITLGSVVFLVKKKIRAMEKNIEKISSIHVRHRASNIVEDDCPSLDIRMKNATNSDVKENHENLSLAKISFETEVIRIGQAFLLSACVLLLSYHGMQYGRTEYSLLKNGRIVPGYIHKAVVTLSIGYSVPYSVASFVAADMLVYSLISKKPGWSFPLIVLHMADLVCDISDTIIAVWLFFTNFPLLTASFYAMGTVLLILGEIWIWLGVLRLFEHRTYTQDSTIQD